MNQTRLRELYVESEAAFADYNAAVARRDWAAASLAQQKQIAINAELGRLVTGKERS